MKRLLEGYVAFWREFPAITLTFHAVIVLFGLFVLGAWLASEGKVIAAVPFLAVFIAIGLLAFVTKPRGW